MAELKTKPTGEDVELFLSKIADEKKREDSFTLLKLMKQVTKLEPKIWASSMVGFGDMHYQYASGHSGDWFRVGFAPRKQNLVLYLYCDAELTGDLLPKIGKHKHGKGCIYINRLADIDLPALRKLIEHAYKQKPAFVA